MFLNLKYVYVRLSATFLLAISFLPTFINGADLKPEELEFFEKKIRPLLSDRCYQCHSAGSEKLKGGLLLDSKAGMLKGGNSGPAIVPGNPEKSLLIQAVRYHDQNLQMPPKDRLPSEAVQQLETWVKMGAPDPRTDTSSIAQIKPDFGLEEARKFWSFQPLRKLSPPAVKNSKWPKTDIDRFVLGKLEEKGLSPSKDAERRTLIRRVTFDLTGLPPTPEEVEAFVSDTSSNAFEKVVDRLLASKHYGEQWGRHWLDLARYADTSGCNSDYPISTAYKYRNYVINSFNEDKPYNEFLKEQIAGDLLPSESEEDRHEKVIATGYLAIARRFGSRASEFHLTIEDHIDNLGKSMLGLTLSCARCHDHKYDPVSAQDYYALYGIFGSTIYAFPGTEIYKHPKDYIPLAPKEQAEEYFKDADELAALDDQIEKLLEKKRSFERLQNTVAQAQQTQQNQDGALQVERKDTVKLPEFKDVTEVKAALEDAKEKQRRLENKTYPFEKAYAVRDGKPANAKIQRKGDPKNLGDEVPRGFLRILGGQQISEDAKGSGRLELANWVADPANPLTARVMVNRIWQHHFGKGIVQTPNDFGARGKAPTHPELLDYLAGEFIEKGWSIKALHKMILLSRVYQLSSEDNPKNASIDLNNDYLWRFERRRLSAEEIRDSMLGISGKLDRSMGGAHPFPPQNEWKYTQHKPFVASYDTNKRSVYLFQQRIRKQPYLEIFDGADPNAPTGTRPITTTAIQALYMMNNELAHELADQFAVRIGMAFPDETKRIEYAYQLAFGRSPAAEEVNEGKQFLADCREALNTTELPGDQQPRAALASYTRVLFSSNEFFYID